jgi:pimeloyl-ACP methyl ester carboxylesterase
MKLELIAREPQVEKCSTPILFVHGAWHGAWCWDEHFLPYFAQQGFTVYALSFRNHGKSESRGQLRWKRGADYVADIAQVVQQIGKPPVLVGHSLGGYVVQKYLERRSVPAAVAVVLLSSVPPTGAVGATLRTFRNHPWAFLKTNLQLRLWPIIGTPKLAQDALFSKSMSEKQVNAYFARLQDESYLAYLDMLFLDLPHPRRIARVPMLAVGGTGDAIISPADVRRTSRTYKADLEIFPGMTHDMMLEPGWQQVADTIIAWTRGVPGIC